MNNNSVIRKKGEIRETTEIYDGLSLPGGYHTFRIEYPAYTPPDDEDDVMYGDYLLYLPRISEQVDNNKKTMVIKQPKRKMNSESSKCVRFNMEGQVREELKHKLNLFKERNKLLEQGLRNMVMRKRFLELIFANEPKDKEVN